MKTTRRKFLGGVAVASLPVAATASAAVVGPVETAHDRLNRLFSEFKATAMEINPKVRFSDDQLSLDDETMPMPLCITAFWATGTYEGDGTYRGGTKYNTHSRYRVRKLDYRVDSQPVYSVIPVGEQRRSKWMTLRETNFESFIGRKLK